MSIFDQINDDIKKAMLAREKEKLEGLRAVKAAFLLEKTQGGDAELTPERELQIIQKLVKQRRETADLYTSQNRPDLAEKESFQADVIATYLPKQLSEAEVKEVVAKIIADLSATSIKDMGKVMKVAGEQLQGQTDNKTLSTIIKSLLA